MLLGLTLIPVLVDVIEFAAEMHLEGNECSTGMNEWQDEIARSDPFFVRGRHDLVTNLF